MAQNSDIKSFDIYRPSWEFLKDVPKFQSITIALQAAVPGGSGELSAGSDGAQANPESNAVAVTRASRPLGGKRAKRALEEEKIIEKVTATIKGTASAVVPASTNSASVLITEAMDRFTSTIINEWRLDQAYKNADPELKRKYDNLLLAKRISELEKGRDNNNISAVAVNHGAVGSDIEENIEEYTNNNDGIIDDGKDINDDDDDDNVKENNIAEGDSNTCDSISKGSNYHNTCDSISTGNNNSGHLIGATVSVAANNAQPQPLVTPAALSAEDKRILARQHNRNWRALTYNLNSPWGRVPNELDDSQPVVYGDSYEESLPF